MDWFLLLETGSSSNDPLVKEVKKMRNINFILPRSLKGGRHLIGLKDKTTHLLVSFIYWTVSIPDGYVMICYSFTDPSFRGKGLNTFLREKVKELAIDAGVKRIVSVPLDGAASVSILGKLGYRREGETYILDL